MYAKNCTIQHLFLALDAVNKKYDDNIIFNREPQPYGNKIAFTLKCKDSKKAGHRLGFAYSDEDKQRRLISACWHVHGDFFDSLFEIVPYAIIYSQGKPITKESGNWEDKNIGSQMRPMYFSEACECQ